MTGEILQSLSVIFLSIGVLLQGVTIRRLARRLDHSERVEPITIKLGNQEFLARRLKVGPPFNDLGRPL